jgi:hypothetical protein
MYVSGVCINGILSVRVCLTVVLLYVCGECICGVFLCVCAVRVRGILCELCIV